MCEVCEGQGLAELDLQVIEEVAGGGEDWKELGQVVPRPDIQSPQLTAPPDIRYQICSVLFTAAYLKRLVMVSVPAMASPSRVTSVQREGSLETLRKDLQVRPNLHSSQLFK